MNLIVLTVKAEFDPSREFMSIALGNKKFLFQVVREKISVEDGDGWNIYIPALGEMFCRATGDDIREADKNLLNVLEWVLESFLANSILSSEEEYVKVPIKK